MKQTVTKPEPDHWVTNNSQSCRASQRRNIMTFWSVSLQSIVRYHQDANAFDVTILETTLESIFVAKVSDTHA